MRFLATTFIALVLFAMTPNLWGQRLSRLPDSIREQRIDRALRIQPELRTMSGGGALFIDILLNEEQAIRVIDAMENYAREENQRMPISKYNKLSDSEVYQLNIGRLNKVIATLRPLVPKNKLQVFERNAIWAKEDYEFLRRNLVPRAENEAAVREARKKR